jgi:hypothetical protein
MPPVVVVVSSRLFEKDKGIQSILNYCLVPRVYIRIQQKRR